MDKFLTSLNIPDKEKKKAIILIISLIALLLSAFFYIFLYHGFTPMVLKTTIKCNGTNEVAQVFYKNYRGYRESHSIRTMYQCGDGIREVTITTPPAWIRGLRIDPTMASDTVEILSVSLESQQKKITWLGKEIHDAFTVVNAKFLHSNDSSSIILSLDQSTDLQLVLPDHIVSEFNQIQVFTTAVYTLIILLLSILLFILMRFVISESFSGFIKKSEKHLKIGYEKIHQITQSRSRYFSYVPIVMIGLLGFFYYLHVYFYSVNIPYYDEFWAAFGLLDAYEKLEFPQNILELFRQHNEHRMFSYHMLVLAQYKIFGILNFKHILLFSNIFIFLLFYLLFKLIPNSSRSFWSMVPIACILFVPLHQNMDWGVMSMNGIFQYCLVFLSLDLLEKRTRLAFVSACILAALATFSFGNGMFTFPLGLIILLTLKPGSRWRVAIWSFIMVVCIGLYFTDYKSLAYQPSKLMALTMPLQIIQFMLMYFGGVFKPVILHNYTYFTLAGGVIVMLLGILFWQNRTKWTEDRVMITYILFVAMSAGAAAISRVGVGVGAALADRYALLPAIFLILLYIYMYRRTQTLKKPIIFIPILLGFLFLYCVKTNSNIDRLDDHKKYLINGLMSFHTDQESAELGHFRPTQSVVKSMESAVQNGIYKPPSMTQLKSLAGDIILLREWQENNNILHRLEYIEEKPHRVLLKGWAILKGTDQGKRNIYLALKLGDDVYFILTEKIRRRDIYKNFKKNYKNVTRSSGFQIRVHKLILNLEAGSYQVGIAIPDQENKMHVSFTDYNLEIPRIDL